jgi:hypothetical protein
MPFELVREGIYLDTSFLLKANINCISLSEYSFVHTQPEPPSKGLGCMSNTSRNHFEKLHQCFITSGIEKSIREKWTKLKEGMDSSKKGSLYSNLKS